MAKERNDETVQTLKRSVVLIPMAQNGNKECQVREGYSCTRIRATLCELHSMLKISGEGAQGSNLVRAPHKAAIHHQMLSASSVLTHQSSFSETISM